MCTAQVEARWPDLRINAATQYSAVYSDHVCLNPAFGKAPFHSSLKNI